MTPLLALLAIALLVALAFLVRRVRVGGPSARRVALDGRNVVVTGASLGSLGFETARILALWGARVVITTRSNPEAARAALLARLPKGSDDRVIAASLDLSRVDSVERFAAWLPSAIGPSLDVLVNNAGIHLDLLSQWKSPHLTDDGHELHWRTNFLGTFDLTTRLRPMLELGGATRPSRVVNVVSMLHKKGRNAQLSTGATPYDSWVAYGLSKLAVVHATAEWDRTTPNVRFFCLHPGSVYTKVADKGLAGNRGVLLLRKVLAPFEAFFLKTPSEGAQTTIHCATADGLVSGRYYRECAVAKASPEADDSEVAARLVRETQAVVDALRIASA